MSNKRRLKSQPPAAIPAETRKYNGYKCEKCGGVWGTVDLNRGVTPMFEPCFATEGCTGRAHSMGYPKSPPPKDLPILIEWYAPASVRNLPESIKAHVYRGGLVRRATADAPEWVKRRA
jgi:hypothetical protein